jgi:2-haloacid dehalogenase
VRPDAIVFDMYGTVTNLKAVSNACADLVEDPAGFGALWRSKQLEYTFLSSLMEDYEDFWQVTEAALHYATAATGSRLTEGQRSSLMQSWLRPEPYEDAFKGLQEMKDRYPLAILSNGSRGMLKKGLNHAGLESFFDHVLSVDEVKVFKPSPKVYGLAPNRLGVCKERILFVSSNSFDVVGAKKYGFQTAWIRREEVPLDPLGETPDYVVSSFEELALLTA